MANTLSLAFIILMTLVLLGINQAQLFNQAQLSSETFTFTPFLNGNTCKDEVQLFSHSGLKLFHCINICFRSNNTACVGVFYKEFPQVCYGCRRVDSADLVSFPGTISLQTGRTECLQYLVQNVSDSQLSESSTFYGDSRWAAIHARLDTPEGSGPRCWLPAPNELDPYFQVDFLELRRVTGIVTQGRDVPGYKQWVTEYRVLTSLDCSVWEYVTDGNGAVQFFAGNTDKVTMVTNFFELQLTARCVRVNPTQYSEHRGMRIDVLGCEHN